MRIAIALALFLSTPAIAGPEDLGFIFAARLASTPLVFLEGDTVTMDVSVQTGAHLWLGASRRLGTPTCPPVLGGACVDLMGPVWILDDTTSPPSGQATFTIQVPRGVPDMRIYLQAAGVPSRSAGYYPGVSAAFPAWVLSIDGDVDGDGVPNAEEIRNGTNPLDASSL